MAKIHKNAEKFPIRWNGTVKGGENQGDSIPSTVNIVWGGNGTYTGDYIPCWRTESGGQDLTQCTGDPEEYYFEDFDVWPYSGGQYGSGTIEVGDVVGFNVAGMSDIVTFMLSFIAGTIDEPPNGPTAFVGGPDTFKWDDVSFIQEIMDGIGTGSRRARQDRLNKILDDEDKKKKLIHLICRVKGEKVYDDVTEVGSVEVKVEDVELVAENIMGKKLTLEIKSGV